VVNGHHAETMDSPVDFDLGAWIMEQPTPIAGLLRLGSPLVRVGLALVIHPADAARCDEDA